MGILERIPEPYSSLKGVHLFHAAMSNCSQRVRIVLEEKHVPWQSHLVNLGADEHLEPGYQALNPEGVVPSLVHDGVGVVESNDIIRYIDGRFPEPPLATLSRDQERQTEELLNRSDELQMSLKLLSYLFLFGDRLKKSDDQLASYAAKQRNAALVEWQRRFSKGEFSTREVGAAVESYHAALVHLDELLTGRAFLAGDAFGLADISWVVNVRRAELIEVRKPDLLRLQTLDRLANWYERVRTRPSFQTALIAFEPAAFAGGSVLSDA